ncbi:hypothetical protein KP509_07G028500 [Ceratopteris richardii]|uniref:Uncharacterized protein n=1 Tax=Ceratopteris richardii TaxID=49495 RepID=A0A8T2UAZ9_CERRI|nr:hypothetical protein KP509_07G028500 [Ceratopteris richardii]
MSDKRRKYEVKNQSKTTMDVTRFQPLTPQEQQRRREDKLCMYCGNPAILQNPCREGKRGSPVLKETVQSEHDIRKGLIIPATPVETCLALLKLIMPKKTLSLIALVDSGASSCFIDEGLVTMHGTQVLRKNKPVVVEVVDGRPLASRNITMETTPLRVHLCDHDSHMFQRNIGSNKSGYHRNILAKET